MSNVAIENLTGLPWLVEARNQIQTLMLSLKGRWEKTSDRNARLFALGAAFSLWRAVFQIGEVDIERRLDSTDLDKAACGFLDKVIRRNAITFSDELQEWSGGYYINNAIYRVTEVLEGRPRSLEPSTTLRQAWNRAFRMLESIVTGTRSGTLAATAPESGEAQST